VDKRRELFKIGAYKIPKQFLIGMKCHNPVYLRGFAIWALGKRKEMLNL